MHDRNGTWHRYYHCRNHDPIRAGGESRRCPERNIGADALDTFVFDHIRAAITHLNQLLAGEQPVTRPPDPRRRTARRRTDPAGPQDRHRLHRTAPLIDLYQGGFIELPEMQRRATEVSSRRKELQHKRTSLADERTALARDNQLRRRVHDFAARIHAVIDTLDDTQNSNCCACSSKTSASPAGTSRSGCASRSTRHHRTRPAQQAHRHHTRTQCQVKTVCVPLVALKGDSYRIKDRDLGRVPGSSTEE